VADEVVSVVEEKLRRMGLALPRAHVPDFNYVPAVRSGRLVFLAGHSGRDEHDKIVKGKLGDTMTVDEAYPAARRAALGALTTLKRVTGDLDTVRRIVKLLCMVNSTPDFGDHPRVANGASDLLGELFGDRGRHARSAVGAASLPGGACVLIEMVVEVEDEA
jgi:enamine deaminase RidA (YjgF/YER057c/UK114 family)